MSQIFDASDDLLDLPQGAEVIRLAFLQSSAAGINASPDIPLLDVFPGLIVPKEGFRLHDVVLMLVSTMLSSYSGWARHRLDAILDARKDPDPGAVDAVIAQRRAAPLCDHPMAFFQPGAVKLSTVTSTCALPEGALCMSIGPYGLDIAGHFLPRHTMRLTAYAFDEQDRHHRVLNHPLSGIALGVVQGCFDAPKPYGLDQAVAIAMARALALFLPQRIQNHTRGYTLGNNMAEAVRGLWAAVPNHPLMGTRWVPTPVFHALVERCPHPEHIAAGVEIYGMIPTTVPVLDSTLAGIRKFPQGISSHEAMSIRRAWMGMDTCLLALAGEDGPQAYMDTLRKGFHPTPA